MSTMDLDDLHAQTLRTAEQGDVWVRRKEAELEAMPQGTVVVIDVATGDYVTGRTWLEAHHLFVNRFGEGTPGFVHRIRDRTFVGGGIG